MSAALAATVGTLVMWNMTGRTYRVEKVFPASGLHSVVDVETGIPYALYPNEFSVIDQAG